MTPAIIMMMVFLIFLPAVDIVQSGRSLGRKTLFCPFFDDWNITFTANTEYPYPKYYADFVNVSLNFSAINTIKVILYFENETNCTFFKVGKNV